MPNWRVSQGVEVSRSRDPTPGDVVITPDRRRWRVSKVDAGFSPGFIAMSFEKAEILSGSVTQLEWYQPDQCWILMERRQGPQRRDQ